MNSEADARGQQISAVGGPISINVRYQNSCRRYARLHEKEKRTMKTLLIILTIAMLAVTSAAQTAPAKKPAPKPAAASGPTKVTGEPTKTASGLEYWDIKVGTGAVAVTGHQVVVDYTGWLTNGKKFDSSVGTGHPFDFLLGGGQVIKGWDEGVAGMKVGGKRQLRIPPDLAYGAGGYSTVIPPNATLIFDVRLVDAK
jgi:FKBP-type peptidyl-prolyl cis-trans isomerase